MFLSKAIPVAFVVLLVVSVLGIGLDGWAIARMRPRRLAVVALALKSVVAIAFVGWWLTLRAGAFEGWGDLTSLAGIIVLGIPVLFASTICDGFLIRAVLRLRRGAA